MALFAGHLGAQTTLFPGDIAFIGINSDGEQDEFSFVLLTNIEVGTSINFTDNGWTALGNFNSLYPESHFTWTASEAIEAGAVVRLITYNGNNLPTASSGSITGEQMTISIAGDQVLAYQGDKAAPSFIAAISFNQNGAGQPGSNFDGDSNSNSTTALPAGLTMGQHAVHIYHSTTYAEQDNARYNCVVTDGSATDIAAAINDYSNWLTDDVTPYDLDPFPCQFDVDISTSVDVQKKDCIVLYPMPAKSELTVTYPSYDKTIIALYNNLGVMVDQVVLIDGMQQHTFNVSHLSEGIYLVRITSEGHSLVRKVMIRR